MKIYDYIIDILSKYNKTIADIIWIGCNKFEIEKEAFWDYTKQQNFNEISIDIPYDILIVGNDFWLEVTENLDRLEYKSLPKKPSKKINLFCYSTTMIDAESERIKLNLNNEEEKQLYFNINSGLNTIDVLVQYTNYLNKKIC